jgi:hypothetical protein
MFVIGEEYARRVIQEKVGGGLEIYLPNIAGVVVAACLKRELNPRAPSVILCGRGPKLESAGTMLAHQRAPIPVFIKRESGAWLHVGMYRTEASFTSGPDFDQLIAGSGRDRSDVSRAIRMVPVRGA